MQQHIMTTSSKIWDILFSVYSIYSTLGALQLCTTVWVKKPNTLDFLFITSAMFFLTHSVYKFMINNDSDTNDGRLS